MVVRWETWKIKIKKLIEFMNCERDGKQGKPYEKFREMDGSFIDPNFTALCNVVKLFGIFFYNPNMAI